MEPGAPVRGLWHGTAQGQGFLFVEAIITKNPVVRGGQIGTPDQRSLLAHRASSDIDAGQFKHQLVNGFWGELEQSGIEI